MNVIHYKIKIILLHEQENTKVSGKMSQEKYTYEN